MDWTPRTIANSRKEILAGHLTCRELVEEVLARASATEPLVSAYAHLDFDGARLAADAADDELRRGVDRGVLHGMPVGVKDVFTTDGMPTRAGSRVLDRERLLGEATVVRRLRNAGAIIIGKHVTHEFACGQDVPPTRNPWRLDCYPGGSSAGAGVSLAVGSSLAAIGTDAGGSIRKPAALTGTVGLKPTMGRISRHGVVPPSGSMDHVGLVTRTVTDAALVLRSLAGHIAGDLTTIDEDVPDFAADLDAGVAGTRIGLLVRPVAEDDVARAVQAAVERAVDALRRDGADVLPVEVAALRHAGIAADVILTAEAGHAHLPWLRRHAYAYSPPTRRFLELGVLVASSHLQSAYRMREEIRRGVRATFDQEHLNVLVTATTPLPAMPLADMVPTRDLSRYVSNTVIANLTGLPAVTVPCGFVEGLPVGLQVIGRPFAEADVLRVAACYARSVAWPDVPPPVP